MLVETIYKKPKNAEKKLLAQGSILHRSTSASILLIASQHSQPDLVKSWGQIEQVARINPDRNTLVER